MDNHVQHSPTPGRVDLLLALMNEEVLAQVRERLSPEQIALLIVEAVNPHFRPSVAEEAALQGVSRQTLSRRKG